MLSPLESKGIRISREFDYTAADMRDAAQESEFGQVLHNVLEADLIYRTDLIGFATVEFSRKP